jgi:aryl-alcohol dehydrogenase-like predicted oxidoreductase
MGSAFGDGYRQRAFLMTKIDGRTKKAAADQIEQSLRALRTDVIDLVQIHEMIRMNDAERSFGPDGAIEALVAAKKAGKLRFIRLHGPQAPGDPPAHARDGRRARLSIRHRPDAPQRHGRALRELRAQGVAGTRRARHRRAGDEAPRLGALLSQPPLAGGAVTPTDCLQYALSLPTSVVITGCDTLGILKQAVRAAATLPPPEEARAAARALLERTARAAAAGDWEQYKTSSGFDGTAQHPWWLETGSLTKPS